VTTTPLSEEYLAARAESCKLLGLAPDDLTPFEAIRCDVLTCLRLWLDSGQGQLLAGGNVDPTKLLAVSEALTKFVPAEPEHKSRGADPRQIMWETYIGMRRRSELAEPTSTYEGRGRRIAELEAEVAALKAGVPAPGESTAPPLPDNVVKLSTRVDNPSPPAAPPKPAPQPQAAAPAYDYNADQSWRSHVLPDGTIIPTPFGGGSKYWGPV